MRNPEFKEYFMYGVSIPYDKYLTLLNTPNEDLEDEDENTYCLFYGRDGKSVIIGRVLEITDVDETSNKSLIIVPELMEIDKIMIMRSVYERFGIDDEFHYYFIKTK